MAYSLLASKCQKTIFSEWAKSMKRISTGRTGIFYRYGENRRIAGGKPDKCFDIVYTKNGKVVFEKVGWLSEGFSLEDACELRALRIRAMRHPELLPDAHVPVASLTFDQAWEILESKWLPLLKRGRDLKSVYKTHIQPHFGNKKLASFSSRDSDTFRQELMQVKNQHSEGGLQPGTIRKIMSDFRRIVNKVYEWSLVEGTAPKIRLPAADRKRERFLTPEEATFLLEELQLISCTYYHIVRIALYTGMRRGELVRLQKQDINLDAGIIHANGKMGRRIVFICGEVKEEIRALLPEKPDDFLFRQKDGKPISPNQISQVFSKIVNALGFNTGITDDSQKVVFHTLRHTFCSWLAMADVSLVKIGALVGHKSTQMTERYAKLSSESQRSALQYIEKALQQK